MTAVGRQPARAAQAAAIRRGAGHEAGGDHARRFLAGEAPTHLRATRVAVDEDTRGIDQPLGRQRIDQRDQEIHVGAFRAENPPAPAAGQRVNHYGAVLRGNRVPASHGFHLPRGLPVAVQRDDQGSAPDAGRSKNAELPLDFADGDGAGRDGYRYGPHMKATAATAPAAVSPASKNNRPAMAFGTAARGERSATR